MAKEEDAFLKEIEKRQAVIATAISLFIAEQLQEGNQLTFKETAAEDITDNYFAIISHFFKPFVLNRIESSKVSSAMEMAVIMALPITLSSTKTIEQINAIFAYQLGAVFSISLKDWDLSKMSFPNNEMERRFVEIITDHRVMLEGMISHEPIETFPLASNAQYWKLLEFVFNIKEHLSFYNH